MSPAIRHLAVLTCALGLTLGSGVPTAPAPTPGTSAAAASPVAASAEVPAVPAPGIGARLGRGDESSEYWDLTAVFDSGHRIFARFSISNEGPGDRTGFALGQIVFPDGHIVPFQNGRRAGDWQLSDDGLRLKMGSSVLDLHGPPYHFEVDKNKKGVKFFLDFESTGPARSWESAPRGIHADLVSLAAKVRGTIWVRGVVTHPVPVTGRITVTHAWMDESEFDLVRRRIEWHGLNASGGPYLYGVQTRGERSGDVATWLVARDGDVWREAEGYALDLAGRSEASEDDYPIAQSLELTGPDPIGRVDMGRRVLAHDPLALAPGPFRWLLSFRAEPSHVWVESRHAIEWPGSETWKIEGGGVSSFYFMNKLSTDTAD